MTDISKKTILLVEDDQFLASLLKNRLTKEDFEILLAKNSDEAISFLETNNPDLIVMDIILPGKSGFEAIEAIAALPQASRVPIIVLSNLGQESDVARGKQLGVIDYFVKAETSIDDLTTKIKGFLKK
jgi:DNA-binding response OmpR family regulator